MNEKVITIFKILEEKKVKYCQWKSSLNLMDSFNGKTDFDLLVSRRDANKLISILLEQGFKRRQSTYNKVYHSMEDYIGFDDKTGKLIHFHLHYTLIMGKKLKKNYRIPLENLVLSTAFFDEKFRIMLIQPEIELILLFLRILIKTKINIFLILIFLRYRRFLPENMLNEYQHLLGIINYTHLKNVCKSYFPGLINEIELFGTSLFLELNLLKFYRTKKRILKKIVKYLRMNNSNIRIEYKIRKKSLDISRSQINTGGLTIAFVGADGSGKSTISKEITNWLNWKLSVKRIYMGIPKSDKIYITLGYLVNVAKKLRMSKFGSLVYDLRWLYISHYRKMKFKKAEEFKNKGYIIIFDRYPLVFFNRMSKPMDGKRINTDSIFGRIEKKNYMCINFPDELICLQVTLEQSIKRKEEHQIESIQSAVKNKVEAIEAMIKSDIRKRICVIDSNQNFNDELKEIKTYIWNIL